MKGNVRWDVFEWPAPDLRTLLRVCGVEDKQADQLVDGIKKGDADALRIAVAHTRGWTKKWNQDAKYLGFVTASTREEAIEKAILALPTHEDHFWVQKRSAGGKP